MSTTLLEFATVNDRAASTTKKLQKQSIFAEYFRKLAEQDLRLAVRFAAGRIFAATDERVLNVGWSKVSDVVLSILKLDPHEYHGLVVRSGEIGEALAQIWPRTRSDSMPLAQLADVFDELARISSAHSKREILFDLFSRCHDPREAAYLAKILFREIRSGAREGVLQAAIAQAFDKELSQIQHCHFLVGDLDEAAVLAKRNTLETATFRLFHPIHFMLAAPQETAELAAEALGGRAFLAEDKLDGIRAQIHKSGDRIAIYTRTLDRTDQSFPDVVSLTEKIPGEFLLDGEIVPWRDGQVLPFAHLQRRLGRKKISARILRENPAVFVAFDILYRDGQLLLDCPLHKRREALVQLSQSTSPAEVLLLTSATPVTTAAQISDAFAASRARRNEGIVLKDPESRYSPGRRGQWWLKLKTHLPTFDCVVIAAEHGHGKRRHVLSDYTFAVWDRDPALLQARLVNVGKAYSGLTDEEIARLTELFLQISTGQSGGMYLVKPQLVLEIACDQIQKSNRHDSGYAFRFPRIKRIRWDKSAQQADRLERIIEIYESSPNFGRLTHAIATQSEPTLFD